MLTKTLAAVLVCFFAVSAAFAGEDCDHGNGLETQDTLYVTSCSHLDTQWRWTIQDTINEHLPRTINENFPLFEKYPDYVLSFEGSFRYQLLKEYYPDWYEKIKQYVASGQWAVAGSGVDAGDVSMVSTESLVRHYLYGNDFFENEFGKRSADVFLPDCFGFGWQLPSIAAHCGLKGFSTQKLSWGSAVGIPYDICVWQGPDGGSLVAALNPGSYVNSVRSDLSMDQDWKQKIDQQAEKTGLKVALKYIGVGDAGGGIDDESGKWLEQSIADGAGPVKVMNTASDQLFRDLTAEQRAKLPVYNGHLLMRTHGVGCYTSQAAMKRLNRKNELLADSAERAAVAADWLGGYDYPKDELNTAWVRFLWHQFHDDLTGTSIPSVYEFSWNDEFLSLNQFGSVQDAAVETVASAMDTRAKGSAVVVYNPLSFARQDVVQVKVLLDGKGDKIRVFDGKGKEVPSQIVGRDGDELEVLFVADMPAVGFKVYDIRKSKKGYKGQSELKVAKDLLENERYKVAINGDGDVSSVYDKKLGRELLAEPIRLAMLHDQPKDWPAWEITYEDTAAEPKGYVGGPADVKVVENGPVRVAVEVVRKAGESIFRQKIELAAGDGGQSLEFETLIDWRDDVTLLKASFPMAADNDKAAYDMGMGAIEHKTSDSSLYEVPAQQWADLSDSSGEFGVAVMNDCKYGWDKPNGNTLRLTLLHSPGPHRNFPLQTQQDFGFHRVKYAVYGHEGDWRKADLSARAARLNQPLVAYGVAEGKGKLGKEFSLVSVEPASVVVRCVKKAEKSDEIIVRLQETCGVASDNVTVAFGGDISAAREVNGSEQAVGDCDVTDGKIVTSMRASGIRTFAVTLADSKVKVKKGAWEQIELPFDVDVVSSDATRTDGKFNDDGYSIPAELWPGDIVYKGIKFKTGPGDDGAVNAVACHGQEIVVAGGYSKLMILACGDEDTSGEFAVNGDKVKLNVASYEGFIGQWESKDLGCTLRDGYNFKNGYLKTDPVAWVATHRHTADGKNDAYKFVYLFAYEIDMPKGDKDVVVTLPDNGKIKVMAMTLVDKGGDAKLVSGSNDQSDIINPVMIEPSSAIFTDNVEVTVSDARAGAVVRYTVDGSEPTEDSLVCPAKIVFDDSTMLRVRSLFNGKGDAFSRGGKYVKGPARQGVAADQVSAGIDYKCYVGEWHSVPDWSTLELVKSGKLDALTIDVNSPDTDFYGLDMNGFVKVTERGVHYFRLACDDGGVLYVGGEKVVNNDGRHGMNIVRDGFITLEAGIHSFRVEYFNGGGGGKIEILYRGPDGVEKDFNDILVR